MDGILYLLLGFCLAGTSVVAARFVTGSLGTFTITAVSLFFALLALLPGAWPQFRRTFRILQARDWLALAFQAGCGIFLFRLFLIQGLLRTSASEAGILTGATPAATALLAVFVLKEQLRPKMMVGVASTVAGILCLQGLLAPGGGFAWGHVLGNMLVLGAALCESLFNVISRFSSLRSRAGTAQTLPPVLQTWLVSGIAFLLCLVPALFEKPFPSLAALTLGQWLALVWYGVIVTALAFILFYAGIRRCSASTAAVFSGMMPFTALVLSILVLGEVAGWQQWLGGALVVVGMILTGSPEA